MVSDPHHSPPTPPDVRVRIDCDVVAEDTIEFGGITEEYEQGTFGAQFVEVAVNAFTGESRAPPMLAVCDCGRIVNSTSARSQVIGG